MKRLLLSAILAGMGASAAIAGPYAGQIRISPLSVQQSSFSGISYYLSDDTSATVVEILDATTSNVVASFPGATTRGPQSLSWNGTTNNAGGTSIPLGSYRVRIVTAANQNATPSGWRDVYSTRSTINGGDPTSVSNAFSGMSIQEVAIPKDTDSDAFGYIYGSSVYLTVAHAAAIRFNNDASLVSPNGFADRVWRWYGDPTVSGPAGLFNTALWGGSPDPSNADNFFFFGQQNPGPGTTESVLYKYNYSNLAGNGFDADPNDILSSGPVFLPRHGAVSVEGGTKYVYAAGGTGTIYKALLNSNDQVTSKAQILSGFTQYSKEARVDAAGNLYWIARVATTDGAGVVYRWNANKVAGLPLAAPLTAANADWTITFATGVGINDLGTLAILDNGDVYVQFQRGISFIGNTSNATLTKVVGAADRIITRSNLGTPSTIGQAARGDWANNIVHSDRAQEWVRLYSKTGVSAHSVVAPTSQTFTVTPLIANASNWQLFE